jgi:hypothetical protein
MGIKSTTNISFIMVVITITILFPQTKSQVCNQTCPPAKYVCGYGAAKENRNIMYSLKKKDIKLTPLNIKI